jgi:hypothetical protein
VVIFLLMSDETKQTELSRYFGEETTDTIEFEYHNLIDQTHNNYGLLLAIF